MTLDFRFKIDDDTNVRICFEERGLHPRGPCSCFIEYRDLRKGGRGLRFNLRGRGEERGSAGSRNPSRYFMATRSQSAPPEPNKEN